MALLPPTLTLTYLSLHIKPPTLQYESMSWNHHRRWACRCSRDGRILKQYFLPNLWFSHLSGKPRSKTGKRGPIRVHWMEAWDARVAVSFFQLDFRFINGSWQTIPQQQQQQQHDSDKYDQELLLAVNVDVSFEHPNTRQCRIIIEIDLATRSRPARLSFAAPLKRQDKTCSQWVQWGDAFPEKISKKFSGLDALIHKRNLQRSERDSAW